MGYPSLEEYEIRLEHALQAHTVSDLRRLVTDLPAEQIGRDDPRRHAARGAAALRAMHIHAAAYLAVVLVTAGIWLATALAFHAWYFWPVWPILGGGIGVISHAVPVRLCSRRAARPGWSPHRGRPGGVIVSG
jgi:Domain of unknown function (DUF1707)/2TM domain